MPNIDLSILNQRQTPAFFADTLANRPAAGFLGRIFVSTDTYAFYRDNGTGWDLIGGPGTGTITGSGATNQVAFWNGSSSITGENNLWWDSVNNHFGINTNTPGTALDIHHDQSTLVQLNQTTATNDTRLAFQNSGTALWRIGNFYNAGANDWGIFDVVGAAQPFTIKKTTGQTFIGAETTTSGRLVVNNATGDNHIVVIGATAPSIRINNAGSGATRQIGIGLATTTNNFIQGTTGGELCLFNSSTTASPILFGIYDAGLSNTQEAARISAARNFIVGSSVDAGYKFDVNGAARVTGVVYADNSIRVGNGIIGTNSNNLYLSSNTSGGEISFWANQLNTRLMTLTGAGNLGLGTSNPLSKLEIQGVGGSTGVKLTLANGGSIDAINDPLGIIDFYSNDTSSGASGSFGNISVRNEFNGNWDGNPDRCDTYMAFQTSLNGAVSSKLIIGSTGAATFSSDVYLGGATGSSGLVGASKLIVNREIGIQDGNATGPYLRQVVGSQNQNITFVTSAFTGADPRFIFNVGGSNRLSIVPTTGNILIGTDTDNGNRLNVNGSIWSNALSRSERFVSNSSFSTNIVFNTFTTFYTMSSTYGGIYLVILCLDGQNTADWAAMAIIYTNGSSSTILTQQNGSLVQITTSGLDIQGKQTGTSPNLDMSYRVLKICNV